MQAFNGMFLEYLNDQIILAPRKFEHVTRFEVKSKIMAVQCSTYLLLYLERPVAYKLNIRLEIVSVSTQRQANQKTVL